MKEEQLFEAFDNIDASFIEETKNRRRKILWRVIIGLIVIVLIILAVLPLRAQRYNPYYYISEEDGQYFLISRAEPTYYHAGNSCCEPWHGVNFDSLQEMHDDFINCSFDEEELYHVQAMLDYHPGKVAIPNLDNLCQPVLPEDIQWDGGIGWSGSHGYSFHTEQNTFQRFSYSVITQEAYDQQKDRLSNYTGTENEEVIRVEHIEDRNATIYYTRTKNGHESSFMYYEIQVGDREIFVEEHRNYYYGNLNSYMHIYIGENGHYGCIYLEPEEARPSVEYLSSFGLAAYEIEK